MAGTGRMVGKVALVTGGASGIGNATVRVLAGEGASVVLADVRGSAEAASHLGEGLVHGLDVDVTSTPSVQRAVAATVERFGRLDVLVNNAGVGWPRAIQDIDDDDWDRLLAVNLKGVFRCIREALSHLSRGASIVNLASVAGRTSSLAMGCHYTASKAGVLGLTRHLARELGPRGIRVNAVCPGPIDTAMLRIGMSDERINEFSETLPVGRVGVPEDIARAILYLASDESSFVTGAALDVNGGVWMG
ncbi:MAG: SDR family NAD(P)-dependent oxidoreductase [Chloroflexota bacterium]